MNTINKNKIRLLSLLLVITSTTIAMEQPVAKRQEQVRIGQLLQAVQAKDFDSYFALLEKEPIEKRKQLCNEILLDYCGMKAIHFAAEQGNNQALEALLELGADVEDECSGIKDRQTPLLLSAQANKLSTILLLLEKGANKLAHDRGNTALHYAAECDNVPAIFTLVKDYGVDPNISPNRNSTGRSSFHTPLHVAVQFDQLDAINALIECGAKECALDSEGRTALHVARSKMTIQLLITKHNFNPNALDNAGKTLLFYALRFVDSNTVKTLIEHGSRLDIQDREGMSILHSAAFADNAPVIALLLKDYNVNPNTTILGTMNPNTTALGVIISFISERSSRCCLAALALRCGGAELPVNPLRQRNYNNFCFSHFRTDGDRQILLESLINKSLSAFDPNVIDSTNQSTSLIKAAKNDHWDCLKLLLKDPRTNPNMQDHIGQTALHSAIEGWQNVGSTSRLDCIKLLLKDPRTDPNIQDNLGKTALHYAVKGWYRIEAVFPFYPAEACRALLRLQRTNVSVKDDDQKTACNLIMSPKSLPHEYVLRVYELRKLFDLRKMRVHTYLALKNARCSAQCQGQTCSHVRLPADVCLKIACMLTEDFLPKQGVQNWQEPIETPVPTIAGSAIIGQLYSMCQAFLDKRK